MKKNTKKIKKSTIYPLYILLAVLSVGLNLALFQINKQQTLESEAQMGMTGDCTVPDVTNTPEEQMVLTLINGIRMQRNLMPLIYDEPLKRPSKWYANDLATATNPMPPMDSLGRNVVDRVDDCGIMVTTMQGEEIGESIRIGPTTPDMLIALLADDQNHVFPMFTHVAVSRTANNWVIVYHAGAAMLAAGMPTTAPVVVPPTTAPVEVPPTTEPPTAAPAPMGGGNIDPMPTSVSLGGVVPAMTDIPMQGGGTQPGSGNPPSLTQPPAAQMNQTGSKKKKKKKNSKPKTTVEIVEEEEGENNKGILIILLNFLQKILIMLGGTPHPTTL